jgi:hypothetical protein
MEGGGSCAVLDVLFRANHVFYFVASFILPKCKSLLLSNFLNTVYTFNLSFCSLLPIQLLYQPNKKVLILLQFLG